MVSLVGEWIEYSRGCLAFLLDRDVAVGLATAFQTGGDQSVTAPELSATSPR